VTKQLVCEGGGVCVGQNEFRGEFFVFVLREATVLVQWLVCACIRARLASAK
jgi:hypothetical protein